AAVEKLSQEHAGILRKIVQRLNKIVADSLMIWDHQNSQVVSEFTLDEISQMAFECVEEVSLGRGRELNFNCQVNGKSTAQFSLQISRPRIERIIANLVGNCFDHESVTKVSVAVELNSEKLRLWICDDGPGFKDQQLSQFLEENFV